MEYCITQEFKYPCEVVFSRAKVKILDKPANFGDVFDGYILSNGGNGCVMSKEDLSIGKYVTLLPLEFINYIVSDRDLNLDGFKKYKDEKYFYSLKGFEFDNGELGDEILDLESDKKLITRFHYIREKILI